MKSLNVELTKIQGDMMAAEKLASEYHEWDVALALSNAIEAIAQAKSKTRETQIASCDRFIHISRLELNATS